jgi:hypothetical protein
VIIKNDKQLEMNNLGTKKYAKGICAQIVNILKKP